MRIMSSMVVILHAKLSYETSSLNTAEALKMHWGKGGKKINA